MGVVAWETSKHGNWTGSETSIEKVLFLIIALLASSAVYLTISKLLRVDEVNQLIALLRRKRVIK